MRDMQLHNILYVIKTHAINTLTNLITSSIRSLIKISLYCKLTPSYSNLLILHNGLTYCTIYGRVLTFLHEYLVFTNEISTQRERKIIS